MRPSGSADYKSVKKPIESCRVLLRPDLNALTVFESMKSCSSLLKSTTTLGLGLVLGLGICQQVANFFTFFGLVTRRTSDTSG